MYQFQVYCESAERWVVVYSNPSRSRVITYAELWNEDSNPHNKLTRVSPED